MTSDITMNNRKLAIVLLLWALAAAPNAWTQPQNITILHAFTPLSGQNTNVDGYQPWGGLVRDASGNLYGTTTEGGPNLNGTVFKIDAAGNFTVLANFGSYSGLLINAAGNIYGTTQNGPGTVFELVNSSGTYTPTTLYSFTGTNGDGATPYGPLIMDSAGNLYGITSNGGSSTVCQVGCGTVFELVNSSGSYTEKVLYSFTGTNGDGANPLYSGLIMDASGNLFGTTALGGVGGYGTVFELLNSSGSYKEKVLYSFTNSNGDGAYPVASLVMDSSGNLFGTTAGGGSGDCLNILGCGTVFKLVNTSGSYRETILYGFRGASADGASPQGAALIMDASGNLYGTTLAGGSINCSGGALPGCGTVFELVNASGSYGEIVLYKFIGTGASGDGVNPHAGVVMDSSGNLYGTTSGLATSSPGTVFKLSKTCSKATTTTTLASSPNPATAGNSFVLAATVASACAAPAGAVRFSHGSTLLGTQGTASGQAVLVVEDADSVGIGTFTLTAQFVPGGSAFLGSSASISQTIHESLGAVTTGSNTFTGTETIKGAVDATSFSGNGSGLTNVTASLLNCTHCVGNTQLGINYAASSTQGGSALNSLALGGLAASAFAPASGSPNYAPATGSTAYVATSAVGHANGVASLDATGKVPSSQLPSTGGTPAILTGWCSGVVSSTTGASFSFAGMGAGADGGCNSTLAASAAVGLPITSAGTLAHLHVYPGTAGNGGTSVTFTVYKAVAPGWAATSSANHTTISALSFSHTTRNVTLTVASSANFVIGDKINVSGISGTYNAGTNCTTLSGSLFDGTYTIASMTATTIAYTDTNLPANCGSDLTSAAASGTAADGTNPTVYHTTRTIPAATTLTCSIGAPSSAAAAVCSDTSHTVAVNAGDLISIVATSKRASGTETIGNIRVTLEKQ